jgi:hypothetical protein
MSDPAKPDNQRPPAGATDPAFKASGPPPRAAGPPKAGPRPGEPGSEAKADAFKVIRTAPPPESDGPGAAPIVAVLVLIVLGVGGFMYARRPGGTTTTTTGSPTTGTTGPAAKPAPDFVIQAIVDAETVANAQRALEKALEYRKEYPGAPNLEAKINELRGRLGQGGSSDANAKLGQAQRALSEQRYDDVLLLTEGVIADSPSPQLLGTAYFISAQANIGKRDLAKAESDLQAAEEAGFDKGALDQLRSMLHR